MIAIYSPNFCRRIFEWLIIFSLTNTIYGQQTLPDFTDEYLGGIWNPTLETSEIILGVTFDSVGKMYLWTKNGKVFAGSTDPNSAQLMLDISYKVYQEGDAGMLGFALDPDYLVNGRFYVYYSTNPSQRPAMDTLSISHVSLGRVERFKVVDPRAAFPVTDYDSPENKVLIGESDSTGVPITFPSHMGGSLVFGTDKSLLLSTGDGAIYGSEDNGNNPNTSYQSALVSRIMTEAENIGSNRAQLLDSHCGKLLRFDPNTGNGLPNNPFYDGSNPRSARSRVWALGLRNPFRIMHIPHTGNHSDDPGDFLVADVGQSEKEEFNLVSEGGQNFGWPHFEGMTYQHTDRPVEYLPTNPTRPIIDYRLYTGNEPGRALKNNTIYDIGSTDVPGPTPIDGATAIAGVYYNNSAYPESYRNTFFVADANAGWIYNVKLDSNYNVLSVSPFVTNIPGSIVSMALNPIDGNIYYVRFNDNALNKIYYKSGNRAPIAKIQSDVLTGTSPLAVAFSAVNSYDLDANEELTYEWDFGDGIPIETGLTAHHVFNSSTITSYKIKLTVTDPKGAKGYDSIDVHINNNAPIIQTNTLQTLNQIAGNQPFPLTLSATAVDDHTSSNNLIYTWQVMLAHNDHEHLLTTYNGNNQNVTLTPLDCELGSASYWYRIYLIVKDEHGLTTTFFKDISLNCGGVPQTISFPAIDDKVTTDPPFSLNATSNSGLGISYYLVEGPASVAGNMVLLSGQPGKVTIRACQHGNDSYNEAPIVEHSFWVKRPINSQTINFDAIPDVAISGLPFNLVANASSGKPIKFLLMSGPVTLSGDTVTLTGQEGTVTIRAVQPGDFNLNGAYQERTFKVFTPCPNSLNLSDTIISATTATFKASQNINATNLIQSPSTIVYQAGTSIELNPGFKTTQGAIFTAQIGGCN
jgi:glucose/arabinose dehydrogenase